MDEALRLAGYSKNFIDIKITRHYLPIPEKQLLQGN